MRLQRFPGSQVRVASGNEALRRAETRVSAAGNQRARLTRRCVFDVYGKVPSSVRLPRGGSEARVPPFRVESCYLCSILFGDLRILFVSMLGLMNDFIDFRCHEVNRDQASCNINEACGNGEYRFRSMMPRRCLLTTTKTTVSRFDFRRGRINMLLNVL